MSCLYIHGHRVHHLVLGVALALVGVAIAWHDRDDWRCALPDLLHS
jgi:hypothetical protein